MATLPNYEFTSEVGTKRRRARELYVQFPENALPTLSFIEEDKIILVDGVEYYPVQARRVVPITSELLAIEIPHYDRETGKETGENRSCALLFKQVIEAITDIYIYTGNELNKQLSSENTPANQN